MSVRSLRSLLLSAGRAFPLVTIHRGRIDASICQIGHVVGVGNTKARVLEIGPDATWNEEPRDYLLRQITRVDFGGDYEDALHVVGGDPPAG